jgi:two-component system CheB/CheR fusion protein
MAALLEMEDAEVSAFYEPLKALEIANTATFDMIISDIGMPEMNGHQLMQALRQLPRYRDTPSIALTGYGAQSDISQSRESGFTQHLAKPVAYDDFIETIQSIRLPDV